MRTVTPEVAICCGQILSDASSVGLFFAQLPPHGVQWTAATWRGSVAPLLRHYILASCSRLGDVLLLAVCAGSNRGRLKSHKTLRGDGAS